MVATDLSLAPRSWNDHDQVLVEFGSVARRSKMRTMTAFALGTALVLCSLGTLSAAAHARKATVVREPRVRLVVRVPVVSPTPWDYYIVPRYRYRPEDDRIDPYGPPPVPVVRYGPQEETVPGFASTAFPPP